MPRPQTLYQHLLRNLQEDEANGSGREISLKRRPVTLLESGACQYTALTRLVPVQQKSVQSDKPWLPIRIVERMTGGHLQLVRLSMIIVCIGEDDGRPISEKLPDSVLPEPVTPMMTKMEAVGDG